MFRLVLPEISDAQLAAAQQRLKPGQALKRVSRRAPRLDRQPALCVACNIRLIALVVKPRSASGNVMPAPQLIRMSCGKRLPDVRTSSTIAQVASLSGLTYRALRYYEEIGLLAPARDRSGARCFDRRQCDRAIMIARLRRMELSLADIRCFLDGAMTDEERRAFLDRILIDQLARLRGRHAEIQMMMDQFTVSDPLYLPAA